jgi:UDP-N-acetylmuramoyl-tripeptide--D-alanyl-D-alanine ligase
MGANHIGEIASYCTYTLPGYGLITNVGKAHLEGFGGYEGVRKGKGELYDHLRITGGTAFVMWDYEYLREMSKGIKYIVKYGTAYTTVFESEPFLKLKVDDLQINTRLVGIYNLPNILAAVAIGRYFKVDDWKIRQAIENYEPSNSRSQLIEKDGNKIILDAYNANPSSMRAAIENFEKNPSPNKVLILGAMAELGPESLHEHREIIELIKQHEWKEVILVGGDFLKIKTSFKTFRDAAEAGNWLQTQLFKNAYFLVKGSRSMQMEKVFN